MSKKDKPDFSLTASTGWLKTMNRTLLVSHEKGGGAFGADSFLNCVHFETKYDGLHIQSEAVESKTHIHIPENSNGVVSYEGEADFLVPVKIFTNIIEQTASGSNSECTINLYGKTVNLISDNEDVFFNVDTIEGMTDTPNAPENFPSNCSIARTNGSELFIAHKTGSLMAKKSDSDVSTGQDPMSGCIMVMEKETIYFYSLFLASSSYSIKQDLISCEEEEDEEFSSTFILSNPQSTSQVLGIFNRESDTVDISFDPKNSRIYVKCRDFMISFSSLNTYSPVNNVGSIDALVESVNDNGNQVAKVNCSKKEISDALSRMSSVSSPDEINAKVGVSGNSISLSTLSTAGNNKNIFRQKISGNIQWNENSEMSHSKWVEFSIDSKMFKSVLSAINPSIPFSLNIFYKEDSSPWLIIIKNNDDGEPDNFSQNSFLIPIKGV